MTAQLYDIVPGSVRHIKPMAANLRPASCATLMGRGVDPRKALMSAFKASAYVRTAIVDGTPIAMWGTQGVMLSDHATIWAVFTHAATKHPLAVVRRARQELRYLTAGGIRLYAAVAIADRSAVLFAETIGLRHTDEISAFSEMRPMVFRRQKSSPVLNGERPPFIIHGLGRSRTAWLAAFLSYGKWSCLHEQAANMNKAADVKKFLSRPCTGYAETAAHFGWPLIVRARPDIRQVVIARPVEVAMEAMAAQYEKESIPFDAEKMRTIFLRAGRTLDKISALRNTLTIPFDDLDTEEGCKRVFEFCLPYKWDADWWHEMRDQIVESDLAGFVGRFNSERHRIDILKKDLKRELFRSVRADAVH